MVSKGIDAVKEWTQEERVKAATAVDTTYKQIKDAWESHNDYEPGDHGYVHYPSVRAVLQCELNEAWKLLEQAWAPYPEGMEWSAYSYDEWKKKKHEWLERNKEQL